ncbi:sensor histidine kinase [Edaphobacter flagellatus]|uniref:sensor histidine kinase n=1 Tax=Edaphobacter flagellatus TaxID=1933044 RepID=UPI0021B26977|nr:HAMP domain-containing sensor histidine kinase [Edaphobacter flagellatus]
MRWRRDGSLRWSLIWRLMTMQSVVLGVICILIVGVLYWTGGLLTLESEDQVIGVLQKAVDRDAKGGLVLRPTPELVSLRKKVPGLWFVIRDKEGHSLSEGSVPPEFSHIGDSLDAVSQARLGWQLGDPPRPNAVMRWSKTSAGRVQILTGPGGKVRLRAALLAIVIVMMTYIGPLLILMVIATLIATPIVIRNALAGLGAAASEAAQIDIDQRGTRLSVERVPAEVRPLVKAVNDALGRLDEGYERQGRFLADAAHELRTPIAILNTRLESYPVSPENERLMEDVSRLSILAEQLLDLERLNRGGLRLLQVDLVAMGERVAADLAPLAIAAGYRLSFDALRRPVMVMGDRASLERALINLVQNAIEHGGRRGMITITVRPLGAIEVMDEGPGIPAADRERIFEPFYRLETRDRGVGLGLNLVREIVELHKGSVVAVAGETGGACFRMTLPLSGESTAN